MGNPGLTVERLQLQIRATQKAVLDRYIFLQPRCGLRKETLSPTFLWEMLCFLPSFWSLGQWQLLYSAVGLYWAVLEPDYCFLLGVPQRNYTSELSKN